MTEQNWADPLARSIAMLIDGSIDPDCGDDGSPLRDDDFLVLINGWWEPMTFTLPDAISARCWQVVCDTFDGTHIGAPNRHLRVGPRSVVICTSPADGSPVKTGLA